MLGEREHGRAVLRKCRQRLFIIRGVVGGTSEPEQRGGMIEAAKYVARGRGISEREQHLAQPQFRREIIAQAKRCAQGLDRRRTVGDDTQVVFPVGVPGIEQRRAAVTEACADQLLVGMKHHAETAYRGRVVRLCLGIGHCGLDGLTNCGKKRCCGDIGQRWEGLGGTAAGEHQNDCAGRYVLALH